MAEAKQQKSSTKDNPPSNAGQEARTKANRDRKSVKTQRRRSGDLDRRHSFTPHGTNRAERRRTAREAWLKHNDDNRTTLPLSAFCT